MEQKKKIKLIVVTTIIGIMIALSLIWGYYTYLDDSWIAKIDGEKISLAAFQERVARMDPEVQELLRSDPRMFVDGFVAHMLLLKAARAERNEKSAAPLDEAQAINEYLMKKTGNLPPVADKDVDAFYDTYKERLGGRSKDEVAPYIRTMLEQRQLYERVQKVVDELKGKARVEINERALKRIAPLPATTMSGDGPLKRAWASGRPVLAAFGTDSCTPCRELKPILDKIKIDYAGRLEVVEINIRNAPALVKEYRVMVVPTLIFFNRDGKESFRHEGYANEATLKEHLARLEAESKHLPSRPR